MMCIPHYGIKELYPLCILPLKQNAVSDKRKLRWQKTSVIHFYSDSKKDTDSLSKKRLACFYMFGVICPTSPGPMEVSGVGLPPAGPPGPLGF